MPAPAWETIAASPRFQRLPPEQQQALRTRWEAETAAEPATASPEPSLSRRALALALRVGGPVVGGTAGFLSPVPGGTYLGAAAGGAAGEALAEKVLGEDLDPVEIGLSGAVSAIPGGRFAGITSTGGRIALRAGQGALQGAGTETARALLKRGELPEASDVATSAALGGGFGAVGGAIEARSLRRSRLAASLKRPPVEMPTSPRVDSDTTIDIDGRASTLNVRGGEPVAAATERMVSWDEGIGPNVRRLTGKVIGQRPDPVTGQTALEVELPGGRRDFVMEHETVSAAVDAPSAPVDGPPVATPPGRVIEGTADLAPTNVPRETSPPPPSVEPESTGPGGRFTRLRGSVPIPERGPTTAEHTARRLAAIDRQYADQTPQFRQGLKDIITRNPDLMDEQTRGVQSDARANALANELRFDPSRKLATGTALKQEEAINLGDVVGGLMAKTERLAPLITAGVATDAQRLEFQVAQQDLVRAVASDFGARAETGRTLRQYRFQRKALETGDPRFIRQALRMGVDDREVARALQTFHPDDTLGRYNFLRQQRKPGWRDYMRWYLVSSWLSGPRTSERNLIGNVLNAAKTPAVTPVAAALERIQGVPMERRQALAGEVLPSLKGAAKVMFDPQTGENAVLAGYSLPKAWARAWKLFRTGVDPTDVSHYELRPPEVRGGLATNFVGRSLAGVDAFFKTVTGEMEAHAYAYREAYKKAVAEGLEGPALKDRIAEGMADLLADRPEGMIRAMAQQERRATYQEESGGYIISSLQRMKKDKNFGPLLDILIPFVRIAGALGRQGVQLTPLGFRTALGRSATRQGALARGEAAAGTLALGALAIEAWKGNLTGMGPKEPSERDALSAQGWKANSFRIGDRYIELSMLGPLAMPASLVANTAEAIRDGALSEEDALGVVGQIAARVGNSVAQQSFLKGVEDFLTALNDPKVAGAKFLQNLAASAVPLSGAMRTIRQMQDPTVRAPRSALEAVEATLPRPLGKYVPNPAEMKLGLPEAQPLLRATGEPIEQEGPPYLPITGLAKDDPSRREISRLAKAGFMTELAIPGREPKLTIGGQKVPLKGEQATAYRMAWGRVTREAMERVMAGPGYARLGDAQKAKLITSAIRRARGMVNTRARALVGNKKPITADTLAPPTARPDVKDRVRRSLGAR